MTHGEGFTNRVQFPPLPPPPSLHLPLVPVIHRAAITNGALPCFHERVQAQLPWPPLSENQAGVATHRGDLWPALQPSVHSSLTEEQRRADLLLRANAARHQVMTPILSVLTKQTKRRNGEHQPSLSAREVPCARFLEGRQGHRHRSELIASEGSQPQQQGRKSLEHMVRESETQARALRAELGLRISQHEETVSMMRAEMQEKQEDLEGRLQMQEERLHSLVQERDRVMHERDATRQLVKLAHLERDNLQQLVAGYKMGNRVAKLKTQTTKARVAMLESELDAKELEAADLRRATSENSKRSIAHMQQQQEAERKALAAQQRAARDVAAATYVQAVERGRRTRAQMAQRKAEIEAYKAERKLKDVQKLAEASVAAARTATELDAMMSRRPKGNAAASSIEEMTLINKDGRERPLRDGMLLVLQRIEREKEGGRGESTGDGKFFTSGIGTLSVGRPEAAALGLASYLKVDEFDLYERLNLGVKAIEEEVYAHGTDTDRECLDYILNEAAGSSNVRFANGVRDVGRNGERFIDFVNHPNAKRAHLKAAHVLALRLYTTAAFRSLNTPLRDMNRTAAHPFSATVFFLTDGIRRLRAIGADAEEAERQLDEKKKTQGLSRLSSILGCSNDLWRGMANMGTTAEFEQRGGAEFAPMSTTPDPGVAITYSQSTNALLFKIIASSFMNRGADISFLSAFPEEKEFLYTPLTYLRPTGRRQVCQFADNEIAPGSPAQAFVVIEVEAQM